jgi:hypothetical protein
MRRGSEGGARSISRASASASCCTSLGAKTAAAAPTARSQAAGLVPPAATAASLTATAATAATTAAADDDDDAAAAKVRRPGHGARRAGQRHGGGVQRGEQRGVRRAQLRRELVEQRLCDLGDGREALEGGELRVLLPPPLEQQQQPQRRRAPLDGHHRRRLALHLRHALVREVARKARGHRAVDQLLARRLLGRWAAVRHHRRRRQLEVLRRRERHRLLLLELNLRGRGHRHLRGHRPGRLRPQVDADEVAQPGVHGRGHRVDPGRHASIQLAPLADHGDQRGHIDDCAGRVRLVEGLDHGEALDEVVPGGDGLLDRLCVGEHRVRKLQ